MNLSMKLLICFLMIAMSVQADAGVTTGGGGGGGIAIGNSFVLLDLFNEGLDSSAPLEMNDAVDPAFWRDLVENGSLSGVEPDVSKALVQKLARVEMVDPYFAAAMVSALKLLAWRFVNAEFVPTKDIQESESITGAPVIPLAIRQGQTIAISKPRWDRMDTLNRTALLVHEVVAALSPAVMPADGTRRAVARLFTARFYSAHENAFQSETLLGFPSSASVDKLLRGSRRQRTGLYTRANFAPLDQRFAFNDGRFPAKVELTSTFLFEPLWQEDRIDRTTFLEHLAGAQAQALHGTSPLNAGTSFERLCESPRAGTQTTQAVISAYELVTWAAPVTDSTFPARFQWGLRERSIADLEFDTQDTGHVMSCTANNHLELRKLNLLARTLYPTMRDL